MTTSRTTWQPPMTQLWYRRGLEEVPASAWRRGFEEAKRESKIRIHWGATPQMEETGFARRNPARHCSGVVIGLSNANWEAEQRWLVNFRSSFSDSIVIGWTNRLDRKWISLFLESGMNLYCDDYPTIPRVARMAVANGKMFALETHPLMAPAMEAQRERLTQHAAAKPT